MTNQHRIVIVLFILLALDINVARAVAPFAIENFNVAPSSVPYNVDTPAHFALVISQMDGAFNCSGSGKLYWVVWSWIPSDPGLPPLTTVYKTGWINIPAQSNPVDLSFDDNIWFNDPFTVSNNGATFKGTLGCNEYDLFSSQTQFDNSLISSGPVFVSINDLNIPLVGDLNLDHIVNSLDWSYMNSKWFTADVTADIDHNGIVNSLDFSIMNANWFKTW